MTIYNYYAKHLSGLSSSQPELHHIAQYISKRIDNLLTALAKVLPNGIYTT